MLAGDNILMIKLSIIIPYYNTYSYTIKLLNELRLQKTDEVEVILIDDGCNEYRFDEFTEFTIIHSEHVGASAAWNIGIDTAVGQFIGFIDSDDMIMMNYVDELIHAIDTIDADEILFNWIDTYRNLIFRHSNSRAIWKAIYRRSICPRFNEDYVCNTDIPFQQSLYKIKHTKRYIDKTLYCYNSYREGSITYLKKKGVLKNESY